MNLSLKGFAIALSVAALTSAAVASQPEPKSKPVSQPAAAVEAPKAAPTAPALPVTVNDLKAAGAKGDKSATGLLNLLDKAKSGDKDAQFQLGAQYRDGLRIKQDFAQAFQWLSKASAQGQAAADFLLGAMYQNGEFVKASPKKALEYYTKAEKGGYAAAKAPADKLKASLKK